MCEWAEVLPVIKPFGDVIWRTRDTSTFKNSRSEGGTEPVLCNELTIVSRVKKTGSAASKGGRRPITAPVPSSRDSCRPHSNHDGEVSHLTRSSLGVVHQELDFTNLEGIFSASEPDGSVQMLTKERCLRPREGSL